MRRDITLVEFRVSGSGLVCTYCAPEQVVRERGGVLGVGSTEKGTPTRQVSSPVYCLGIRI